MNRLYYGDMPEQFSNYETSKIVLLPVPYDGTSTWVKGADKGPQAIIEASESIELYDIETETEVYTFGIHTAEPVLELGSPEEMVDSVYQRVTQYINDDKYLVILGGEHSVSCGAIKAFSEKYQDLTVLQIDAHADLRDDYHGSKYNHACVMRRAQEHCKVVQVGVRSMCIEEKPNMIPENMFFAHQIRKNSNWILDVVSRLGKKVYLTIDLDGFDPSIIPSTGTPEPGGLLWWDVMDLIKMVNEKCNIVGFDVVELCPNPQDKSSDLAASKLVYQILSQHFKWTEKI
ncbi:MAG: agmatinase [Bacteroidota bacterium]